MVGSQGASASLSLRRIRLSSMSLYAGLKFSKGGPVEVPGASSSAPGVAAEPTASTSASPSASPAPSEAQSAAEKAKREARYITSFSTCLTIFHSSHMVCSTSICSCSSQKAHQARVVVCALGVHCRLRVRRGVQCASSSSGPSYRRPLQGRPVVHARRRSPSERSLRQCYLSRTRASPSSVSIRFSIYFSSPRSARATSGPASWAHARRTSFDDLGRRRGCQRFQANLSWATC